MPKHFVANEQETQRKYTYSTVDPQVLREIYLIPFEMAVKDGKAGSIMCAYNYLNGVQACQNDVLNDILRTEWGFTGYVHSACTVKLDTAGSLLGGLDHEMFLAAYWTPEKLREALVDPSTGVTWEVIERSLERRFTQMFKYGILDRPIEQTPIDFAAGGEKAREIGVKSAVLLKNRNDLLPLSTTLGNIEYVTVIGKVTQIYAQQAIQGGGTVGRVSGGGSSDVIPEYTVAPVEGIAGALGASAGSNKVRLILVDDDNDLATVNGVPMPFGKAISDYIDKPENKAIIIMAGTIAEESGDRGTVLTSLTGITDPCEVTELELYSMFSFISSVCRDVLTLGWDPDAAYHPRNGMTLDWYTTTLTGATPRSGTKNSQTQGMIDSLMTISGLKEKTVLVLKDNASISVRDTLLGDNGPAAILEVWFPGQEDGNIVADLLFGKANPSGKLPVTFPREGRGFIDHINVTQFPGTMENIDGLGLKPVVRYSEDLHMGYRWYDGNRVPAAGCTENAYGENDCVAFPFGYGLSYTSFAITGPSIAESGGKVDVKVKVTNTGSRKGAEVVQVYLQLPASANTGRLTQPPKRLVGFAKVELEPGAQQEVSITIDPAASNHPLGVWDEASRSWVTPSGNYTVLVGNSSAPRDLKSAGTITR
jgi:beta-glucosidase